MSSSDRGRGDAPGARNEPAPAAKTPEVTKGSAAGTAADPYANWLDRMQRARVRHAAITKNLYTWSNYKNWADRMRDSWEDGPPQDTSGHSTPANGSPKQSPKK
jgi:hypothetical protein